MADLVLGPDPGSLSIRLVAGDPWRATLTLRHQGENIEWPEAPVLEFAGGVTWAATLDIEDKARAEWLVDEVDVAQVMRLGRNDVRLSVEGQTWWSGKTVSRG